MEQIGRFLKLIYGCECCAPLDRQQSALMAELCVVSTRCRAARQAEEASRMLWRERAAAAEVPEGQVMHQKQQLRLPPLQQQQQQVRLPWQQPEQQHGLPATQQNGQQYSPHQHTTPPARIPVAGAAAARPGAGALAAGTHRFLDGPAKVFDPSQVGQCSRCC